MGKGGLGRVSQGVNKVVTGVADSPLRVSAMIHELSKEKIVSKFNPVWTEKEKKATLEFLTNESSSTVMAKASNVSHRATDSMADFNRMSPGARRIARRFFIVPNWLVAGTRYPAYFAGSYPGRSAAIAYAATGEPGLPGEIAGHRIPQNDPIWQYLAKGTPPWATGFPFGDKVARVGSVLPASMMGDIGLSLATGNPYEAGQYINPAITAGVTGLMGYVPHPNYMEHVGPLDALSQNFQHLAPNKKLIEDLINRSGSTTYPDDKTILGRLARETGVLPIHVSRGTSKGAKGSSTHYHRKRRRRSRSHSDTLDNVLKGSSGAGDTSGGGALDSVLK
jgi:hypothetical protein